MDVANELPQIAICLAENRLIACLKEMPDFLVFTVVILAVAGKHPLHDPANRIVLHLDQKMHVVWHEAVGVEIKGQLQFLLRENASEPEIVVVRSKCLPAVIAASNDVIQASTDLDPWLPGHGGLEPMLVVSKCQQSEA